MDKKKNDEWRQVISTDSDSDTERRGVTPLPPPTIEETKGDEWQAPEPVDGWKEVVYPVESGSSP